MGLSHTFKSTALSRIALFASALAITTAVPSVAQEQTMLETLIVTAAGSSTSAEDAPASVTVIRADELAAADTKSMQQILASAPGVSLNKGGNTEQVQIRGLSERYTLFMIDGKRVSSAPNLFRGNDFDSAWIPLSQIENIEIVRGPMSSLYGSDAIGGVINVITKRGADRLTGGIETSYTFQEDSKSGDYWRTSGYLAGPIVENMLSFNASASWDHREADADDINAFDPSLPGFLESDNKYLALGLDFTPDAYNAIDLDYDYSRREHDDVPMERNALSLIHNGDYDFGSTELKIWGDRVHNFYGHGNRTGVDQPNTAYNANIDGKVILPLDFGFDQSLTLGGTANYQQIDDPYVLQDEGTSDKYQLALYAEDEIWLTDDFALTLGNRLDYHEDFGVHNSPRAYGVYHLTDEITFRGGVSTAFKAPTLLESSPNWYQVSCGGDCTLIGSEDLDPESSISGEFGIDYNNGTIQAGATYFRNDLTDMIPFPPARVGDPVAAAGYSNFVGLDAAGNPIFSYENIESALTQGVEVTLGYTPNIDWAFRLNYTYTDAAVTSGVERPLAYHPEHEITASVDWQATEQWSIGADLSYTGEQYTSVSEDGVAAGASKAGDYMSLDLRTSYAVNNNLSLSAAIENALDQQLTREDSNDFNVDGRRYTLSLRSTF